MGSTEPLKRSEPPTDSNLVSQMYDGAHACPSERNWGRPLSLSPGPPAGSVSTSSPLAHDGPPAVMVPSASPEPLERALCPLVVPD